MARRSKDTGITTRHSRRCGSRSGGACDCEPTYQANVWSRRDERRIRKTFRTKTEAKAWRAEALVELRRGTMRAPTPETVAQAAAVWLEGARSGVVRNRSGNPYKPSAIRSYERALRRRVLPRFGDWRVSELTMPDVQDLVDELLASGLAASTIDTTLNPLRAIYRRAAARGLAVNPTRGVAVPGERPRRERFASPEEAERLIEAVPAMDQAIWATAMYGGLRRGELQALELEAVDLPAGVIRAERAWDPVEGLIELKSKAGRRKVPIPAVLRRYLAEDRLRRGRAAGLAFGRTAELPFDSRALSDRADRAWEAAGLERITLHECRHTYASLMIAAGVNAKALQTYMGHANIAITYDRYGHLMPGNEEEAAGRLDAYLEAGSELTARQLRDN